MLDKFSRRIKGAIHSVFGNGFDHFLEPLETAGLRAVCYETFPNELEFVQAWERLISRSPNATAFHSPIWQRAAWETLGKEGRLRLIVVWNGREMAAVLPMSMRDDGLLETLGPSVTDYLDALMEPGTEGEIWRIILKLMSRLRSGKRRNVTLHYVRDADASRKLLPTLAHAERFSFEEKAIEYTPVLALPKSWDEYLAGMDAHERKETKRKINKVMSKGNGRMVRCSASEVDAMLPAAFGLMEQAPGDKGLAVKAMLRPLLERAAPTMIALGKMWLNMLYVNDRPAACTIQFPHGGGPMLYNCGFENELREWSPGVVLTALIIKDAIEAGAPVFDLLRGQEQYKYRLGAVDRPLWMLNLKKT